MPTEIPRINVVTDLNNDHNDDEFTFNHQPPSRPPSPPIAISPPAHTQTGSYMHDNPNLNPGLLSPLSLHTPGRQSPGPTSPSPTLYTTTTTTTSVPPSPTLSHTSSVHFEPTSSLALRDNKPDLRGGQSSSHRRKGSNATFASDTTGVDNGAVGMELRNIKSNNTSITQVDSNSRSRSHSRATDPDNDTEKRNGYDPLASPTQTLHAPPSSKSKSKSGDGNAKETTTTTTPHTPPPHPTPTDTTDTPTGPFPSSFQPYALAGMLDPKSLDVLEGTFGGVRGLLRGLGVRAGVGVGSGVGGKGRGGDKEGLGEGDGRPGAGSGASHRHDPEKRTDVKEKDKASMDIPGIVVTSADHDHILPPPHEDEDDEDDFSSEAYTASLETRREIYGHNVLPIRKSKGLFALMWAALKDKVLILLAIAAVVSLVLGFVQDFGTPRAADAGPPVEWVEGVAIMIAIFIVVIVGSINDWQKERQFQVLNEKKEERGVKVIRDGVECVVDIKEVVVGDIALLEPGEIIPCDGIFLSGHNVKCDESGATGESDAIKKVSYEECLRLRGRALGKIREERERTSGEGSEKHRGGEAEGEKKDGADQKQEKEDLETAAAAGHTDCFIVSGSKVLEGVGSYVVVAVGTRSFNGRIMMALRGDAENTPLQLKLNDLAELIAKLGSMAGLILFSALMIRFFVQLGKGDPVRTANEKGIAFVNILIISVTLVVVAVPEGLPLAVTLALAFATKRMTYEKLLVRVLGSCETMANASVVCTDKTGTLTQNVMSVVAGSVGIHGKFVRRLQENNARTNADEELAVDPTTNLPNPKGTRRHVDDFSIDQGDLNTVLTPQLRELFNSAICVNSTAFEDTDRESGQTVFVGSKTETALLKFAQELGWGEYKKTRDMHEVVQMIPFSSERKAMGVVVKLDDGRWRVYLKGASEILSKKCTRHVVVHQDGEGAVADDIETKEISKLDEENIQRTIIFYANQTLRTIALCYRDFNSWPPRGVEHDDQDEVSYNDLAEDLTLIAITGIEDPLRDGVREAVANCHKAGVTVKMCTGDNVLTARSIALQCGIYTAGGIIMEGPVFRQLSPGDMLEIVPRLQVLARSSPEDKKILVETLKSIGETVGVTGDGTNDGPALKTANVGFSMGIAGTEVAKEASDIILMDDNFASIVKAIMWGRCVNDAVRKFLQFQVSTNVTAVVITFVSAVASTEETSVLSAVQLLWINIIMDTFAALALATDPASEALLDRKPDKKTAPLFSVNMYKQILFQSMYQIIITLIFHFLGLRILGYSHSDDSSVNTKQNSIVQTLVFNAFVFAQIFNSINCRRLDRHYNIFEGISRNWYFIIITIIEIGVQILIVFVGGAAFQVTRVGGREWGISLALGVVSIPLGALIRLLPNEPFEKLFKKLGLLGSHQPVLPTTRPDAEWNSAIQLVRDNLGTFANLRGGRVRSSSFVVKSRSARLSNDDERLRLPSLMTMVPSLVASSIGAGWAPNTPSGSLSDPAHSDPSKSSAALWEGKIQIHPDTPRDDPAFKRFGPKST